VREQNPTRVQNPTTHAHEMKQDNTKQLTYLLATNEFRGLEDIEKAVKLVEEHEANKSLAAKVCHVDRSALRRALQAKKERRPWGVPGRSRNLTLAEEERLESLVDNEIKRKQPPSYKAFQDMVC